MFGLWIFGVETNSQALVKMIQGDIACPWRLQRDLEELVWYKGHFCSITHCYREANKLADRLANVGADLGKNCLFDPFEALPSMVCGEVRLDRSGFLVFRRKAR